MLIPVLAELTDAQALAYGVADLNLPAFEAEYSAYLETLNFDRWIEELEEAEAYRALVAGCGYRAH